jgi:hypothetical protein
MFKQFIGKSYLGKLHSKRDMNLTTERTEHMRAFNIAVVGVCAALYAVTGILTSFGLTFGGVAFWPAAVVPAVFAVLFGPWVGGVGAAIGIFIRDMVAHGNPLLSLSAGVTGNFVAFFLIGYLSRTDLTRKKLAFAGVIGGVSIVGGLMLPTLILPAESTGYTQWSFLETITVFAVLSVFTLAALVVVTRKWQEWKNFTVASFIGMGIGGAVLTLGLWAYSQVFVAYPIAGPIGAAFAPIIFVWTFATEIPFVLLIGPPVVNACYKAFPSLRKRAGTKATR